MLCIFLQKQSHYFSNAPRIYYAHIEGLEEINYPLIFARAEGQIVNI